MGDRGIENPLGLPISRRLSRHTLYAYNQTQADTRVHRFIINMSGALLALFKMSLTERLHLIPFLGPDVRPFSFQPTKTQMRLSLISVMRPLSPALWQVTEFALLVTGPSGNDLKTCVTMPLMY